MKAIAIFAIVGVLATVAESAPWPYPYAPYPSVQQRPEDVYLQQPLVGTTCYDGFGCTGNAMIPPSGVPCCSTSNGKSFHFGSYAKCFDCDIHMPLSVEDVSLQQPLVGTTCYDGSGCTGNAMAPEAGVPCCSTSNGKSFHFGSYARCFDCDIHMPLSVEDVSLQQPLVGTTCYDGSGCTGNAMAPEAGVPCCSTSNGKSFHFGSYARCFDCDVHMPLSVENAYVQQPMVGTTCYVDRFCSVPLFDLRPGLPCCSDGRGQSFHYKHYARCFLCDYHMG